jgi:hypothetical protein
MSEHYSLTHKMFTISLNLFFFVSLCLSLSLLILISIFRFSSTLPILFNSLLCNADCLMLSNGLIRKLMKNLNIFFNLMVFEVLGRSS